MGGKGLNFPVQTPLEKWTSWSHAPRVSVLRAHSNESRFRFFRLNPQVAVGVLSTPRCASSLARDDGLLHPGGLKVQTLTCPDVGIKSINYAQWHLVRLHLNPQNALTVCPRRW
jgi:hypothetical protein